MFYKAFLRSEFGKNYDAAVLSAGHCGFAMGATPTAVANMQAITNMYGPSHKAFFDCSTLRRIFCGPYQCNSHSVNLEVYWLK